MTIFEVLQKRNKEAIFDLKCKIVQVLAREHLAGVSAGTGKAYDFFVQKILLGDDTATLWAQLTDCPMIESKDIGQQVLISAKESKFGLLGANLSISADGKYRTLKISKSGTFCIGYDENVAENARKSPELPMEPKKELEKPATVPEIGKETPVLAPQVQKPVDWTAIEERKHRGILLNYAILLVNSGKIELSDMENFVNKWTAYIWQRPYAPETGDNPEIIETNIDKRDYDDSPVDSTIPF